jgi:hypothetical protein
MVHVKWRRVLDLLDVGCWMSGLGVDWYWYITCGADAARTDAFSL